MIKKKKQSADKIFHETLDMIYTVKIAEPGRTS